MLGRRNRYFVLAMITLLPVALAGAQGFDPSTEIDVPTSIGHGTDVEHVDLMSGAVVVRIPLLHLKGRGIDTDIVASYTSKLWSSRTYQDPYSGDWFYFEDYGIGGASGAWSIGVPSMIAAVSGGEPTDGSDNYIILDSLHRYDGSTIAIASPTFYLGPYAGPLFSYDGSYVKETDAIYMKNGDRLSSDGSGDQVLEDPNGNKITCSFGANCTDTLGRTITQTSTSSATVITHLDSNGAPQNITINLSPAIMKYPWVDSQPVCSDATPVNCVFNGGGDNLISSIVFPDGTSYLFQYADNGDGTSSGELTKLTLPTGGYIRYTYTSDATPGREVFQASGRVVSQRLVSPDGTTEGEQPWTYTIPYVSDPVGNLHTEAFSYSIAPTDALDGIGFPPVNPVPISIQSRDLDASGALLRQVDSTPSFDSTDYAIPGITGANNPRIVKKVTTLGGSTQQMEMTTSYTSGISAQVLSPRAD